MLVPAALFVRLVPDEVVDETLIDALACQGRDEAVPQYMPAFQNLPLAVLDGPAKRLLRCLAAEDPNAWPEQQHTRLAVRHPGLQHAGQSVTQRTPPSGPSASSSFLLADRNGPAGEVHILRRFPHHLASSRPSVCGEHKRRINPRTDRATLDVVKEFTDLRVGEVQALPEPVSIASHRDASLDLGHGHEWQLVFAFRIDEPRIRKTALRQLHAACPIPCST